MASKDARTGVTWQPRPYQVVAVRHLVSHPHAGLLMDPGMGKTSCVLAALDALRLRGFVKRALIVTTLRAAETVWGNAPENEVSKWGFSFTRMVAHGPGKEAALREPVELTIINWEALIWFCDHTKSQEWAKRWDVLILDESTKIKNSAAKRFKALRKILHRFQRRIILTGTPAPKNLLDLFGQIYTLDRGAALGQYITHYRRRWFTQYGHQWVPNKGAEEEIHRTIAPLCVRFGDEELGDLQPMIKVNRYLTIPPDARARYNEMEQIFYTELQSGIVTASNAGVKTAKLRQIANGGLYLPGGIDWEDLHAAKVFDLAELIDELQGQPLLVAYEFKHDLARLLRAFGQDAPHVGGGDNPRLTASIFQEFNAGRFPFLFAQSATLAHAVNLQEACHHVAWHSLTYDFEVYHQFNKRVHRLGQRRQVIVHHLVAADTIDEDILKILDAKRNRQARLLEALTIGARARLAVYRSAHRR